MNSRKAIYATSLTALSTLLLMSSYISESTWLDINKWAFGIYASGNVASKVATKFNL